MLQINITGKGRVESSDDEGSFNDAASMVSDVSEVRVGVCYANINVGENL